MATANHGLDYTAGPGDGDEYDGEEYGDDMTDRQPGDGTPLLDRVGIITGAARGIGRAIATTLAEAGASLLLNDINEGLLTETVELLASKGHRVRGVHGDVADVSLVRSLPQRALTEFGRLDFVVNNAAAFRSVGFLDLEVDTFDEVYAVNVRATFVLTQTAAQLWIEQDRPGGVLNLSSVSASFSQPRQSHYAASKAAVERMSRNMALELAPYGIRVNCIAPGGPILSDYVKERMQMPEYATYATLRPPLGRLGEPEEVAQAALFLLSDASSYVTGTVLTVDGGLTLGRSYAQGNGPAAT